MPDTSTSQEPVPSRRRARWPWILGGAVAAALVLAVAGLVITFFVVMSRPIPEFPSLTQNPDPSLHGTVAYFDDQTMCVRAISASGATSRQVLCIESQDPSEAAMVGKDVGANLFWRDDNRLEITLFRMTDGGPDPVFTPAWQKVVDVVTGAVEETPIAEVSPTPTTNAHPTTSPDGATVSTESDGGHAVVTLTDSSGTRTLVDVTGSPETYAIQPAYWAPDFGWIIANDNRTLVITPTDPSNTRILLPALTMFYGYDALSRVAVTGADLLTQ